MSFGFAKTKKKKQKSIEYSCDNCGAKVTAHGKIPRCLGCGKQLCDICGADRMICGTDFNQLEKKDQKKIKRAGMALEGAKASKRMFTIMPIVMGSIAVILLILMVVLGGMFYFLFGFLSGFLLLCTVMIFCVFHNIEDREKTRITRQIRDILLPYNIKRAPAGPIKIEVIHCPHCGGNITEDTEICEWCGSTLKESPENP